MDLTLSFTDLDRQLYMGIMSSITKRINKVISSKVKNIRVRCAKKIIERIKSTDEYKEISSGGDLLHELGMPDPNVLDTVVNKVAERIQVYYETRSGKEIGAIQIKILQSDYSDLLTLPEATYTYSTGRGAKTIDWLRWLLLEGTTSIVLDYKVDLNITKNSRTGYGVMIKDPKASWSIPPEYAGVAGDNFLTRALKDITNDIDIIARQELTKGL